MASVTTNIEKQAKPTNQLVEMVTAVQVALEGKQNKVRIKGANYMGYKTLNPAFSFASQVTATDTIYIVQNDFELSSDFTMPSGSILNFDGGKIVAASGTTPTLTLNDTSIESQKVCFGDGIKLSGKALQEASPEWFTGSDADKIERAINTFSVVKLAARDYLIDRTINVDHSFTLKGSGIPSCFGNFTASQGGSSNYPSMGDYSQSRLVPTGEIGCILACVNPDNKYVSCVLSGVSFYCKTSALRGKVNGFAISTPNGPSRPVVIENCNFKYLKYGIHIYDYDPSLNRATNVGRLLITGCNISLNKEGIHVEGKFSLGGVMIDSNVIEQNTDYGIYCYNPSGSTFEDVGAMTGYIVIENNLIEGEDTPIYCSLERGTILLKGNYCEIPTGSTITVHGKALTANYQTLILDSNVSSTNLSSLVYNLRNLTLIDRDNGDATGTLSLSNVIIASATRKKILGNRIAYTPAIGNSRQPLIKKTITPTFIYDGKLAYKTNSTTFNISLSEELPAGDYILVTHGKGFTVAMNKVVGGTTSTIFEQTYIMPTGLSSNKLLEKKFTLDTAIPAGSTVKIITYADDGASYSGFGIYADSGNPHSLLSFDPNDYLTGSIGVVENPQIGCEIYDKSLNKMLRIADVVNGAAVWKDLNGFTPALSRGYTEERPTALLGITDVGFPFYDRDISKDIYFALFNSSELYNDTRLGNSNTHITNTLADGAILSVVLRSSYTLGMDISFVKSSSDYSDAIPITSQLYYYTDDRFSSKYRAKGYVVAPDPSVYTRIKITNNGGACTIILYEAVKTWHDSNAYTAGASKGSTTNRPTLTDGDYGYTYWDTTLGKLILWDGTAWVNLDGTALS